MPVILLYGDIGEGINTGHAILAALAKAGAGEVTLAINSGGGSIFEAQAIYLAVRRHGRVTARIDGVAASAASYIAMAAKRVVMAQGSFLMIHSPAVQGLSGNPERLEQTLDTLRDVEADMARVYADRSRKPVAEILELLRKETWMTAAQAVAQGFADAIDDELELAANVDLSRFRHVPPELAARTQDRGPRRARQRRRAVLAAQGRIAAHAARAPAQRRAEIMARASSLTLPARAEQTLDDARRRRAKRNAALDYQADAARVPAQQRWWRR